MSFLLGLHNVFFRAGALLCLVIAAWGIYTHFRGGTLSPGFRSTLVLTEVLFVAQGLAGIGLLLAGAPIRDKLHILYGILLVIALPIAASYTSAQERRREPLVFGAAGILMFVLTLRALMTSGG